MAAVVEVDAGQAAKRNKATDEEGKTPAPLQPVGALRKHHQPTPDHPPYCWMIGEAIDELCENGGTEEDSISAFIRARYPGVPAAHDRLLRHYLDKHLAEGFFVRTAAGRYLRSPEEYTAVERTVEQAAAAAAASSEPACVGSPVAEAKRGRGRPRKDGSSLASPAGKKDGARSASPRRRGRRRAAIGLGTDEDSDPATPAAVPDRQDGSQAASLTPRRRTLRRAAVQVPADEDEDSVPMSPVAVADKKDGSQAASSTPKRRGRLRRLGVMDTTTDSSGKALVASEENGGEVPYLTDKEHEPPRELALVIVSDGPATASIAGKACAEAPPTKAVDGGQPLELALVSTTDVPVPAATPAMDNKEAGGDAPSFNLALVPKNGGICATTTAPESSSQACERALVAGSVSVLVADKDGVEEAPSATNKRVHQHRKAGSAPGKKAGGEALSATPKDRRRRRKGAAAVATDHSARTPVPGKKAGRMASSASPKLKPVTAGGIEARRLYPVTADEIDPACILLALPSLAPAVAKA